METPAFSGDVSERAVLLVADDAQLATDHLSPQGLWLGPTFALRKPDHFSHEPTVGVVAR